MNDDTDSADAARPTDAAVAAREDPPRGDRMEAAPVLTVDGFEGPLDWWLEMAHAQKIQLAKLSIATLIGGFATAMDAALARRVDGQLARWAVWTVMAASLTELWSRLLPPDAPAARAAVEEAEALRRQLLDRARMRAAADWLERCGQLGRDVFRRGQPEVTAAGRRGGDLTELLRACLSALRVPEDQAVALRPRPPLLWTASDAMRQFSRLLPELPDGSPLAAFLPRIPDDAPARALRCRAAISSTLIAGLERARDGALVLDQDADWMPIRITRRANLDPVAGDPAPPV